MPNRITFTELRNRLYDIDVADDDLRPYLVLDEQNSTALNPVVIANPDLVDDPQHLEGAVAVGFLNGLSRWRRQQRYRRRIRDGWSGPKLVSEGDSWFQYPMLLDDIIDQLEPHYAIFSLGAAGDLLGDMVRKAEYLDAIAEESPNGLLISGGGNDMVGDGRLANMLERYHANRLPENYPNALFERFLEEIQDHYRTLFNAVSRRFPTVKIFCHGYDYAIPNAGKWLGDPMASIGIRDRGLQRQIVRVLIDRFNDALRNVTGAFVQAAYVNCRNAVADHQWHDELHPINAGYAVAAERFSTILESSIGAGSRVVPQSLSPGRELFVRDPQPIDPNAYRKIVARQGRKLGVHDSGVLLEEDRHGLEASMRMALEKIDQGADFQPAKFLRDGARCAAAVCRIVLPGGCGSGFLVASRGFIMTNHHVLNSVRVASLAQAEFGFEEGGDVIRVALNPDRLFITDEDLDFTIVACDAQALADIEPIPLLRDPATIARDLPINIIQHPSGRPKEIAIRNNHVTYLYETVIRYRTDTEPGSSGSAAFNDDWQLVALHHAGVNEPNNRATNEGIRIAAIVAHLIAMQKRGNQRSDAFRELMAAIDGTSPFLGFFDVQSAAADGIQEVEVPDFVGSRDFADVGFWNIEHFNGDVDDERVERVADVLHRLSMDVIGLTEVENPALERLKAALTRRGNAYDYELFDVPRRQDLAVFYDQDTTTVTLRDDLNQKHRSRLDARTRAGNAAFPRDPMFVQCEVTEQRREPVRFLMIVVHFKAFGDVLSKERRHLAAQMLAEIIDDIRQTEDLPVVLGGDFNNTLSDDVLGAITDAPDLFALTADDQTNDAISYVGKRHRSLIDHIVVSNDVQMGTISGDDAAIVRLDQTVTDFSDSVSDHVPVVVRLVLRPEPLELSPRPDRDDSNGPTASVRVPRGQEKLTLEFQWHTEPPQEECTDS